MKNSFEIGSLLDDRYKILDVLGIGGMGKVYKALQVNLDRIVAIKVPSRTVINNPEFLARFIREGRTCAKVSHGNIVAIHDVHSTGDRPYIVMEYAHGQPLNHFLREESTTLFVSDLLDIIEQICTGLAAAHAANIVHRDIKPANIVITFDNHAVKIMDFGIARVTDVQSVTTTGSIMGTPYYMAPEQIRGDTVCGATDIYALSCIVYRLFTGFLVFRGEVTNLIYHHTSTPPTPPSKVNPMLPKAIDKVLIRGLEKKIVDRFQSPLEFHRELRKALRPLQSIPYSQVFDAEEAASTEHSSSRIGANDETQTLAPHPAAGPAPQFSEFGAARTMGLQNLQSASDSAMELMEENTDSNPEVIIETTDSPEVEPDPVVSERESFTVPDSVTTDDDIETKMGISAAAKTRTRWAPAITFGFVLALVLVAIVFKAFPPDRTLKVTFEKAPVDGYTEDPLQSEDGGVPVVAQTSVARIGLLGFDQARTWQVGDDLTLICYAQNMADDAMNQTASMVWNLRMLDKGQTVDSRITELPMPRYSYRFDKPGDYKLTIDAAGRSALKFESPLTLEFTVQ